MKLKLLAVGTRMPSWVETGFDEYHKRMPAELKLDLIEIPLSPKGKGSANQSKDAQGQALRDGAQVQIGGNETYVSLCRRHWREATGDPASPPLPLR